MSSFRSLLLCSTLALVAGLASAELPEYQLVDITGKKHQPGETEGTKDAKVIVFVFVSIDCPIANFYQPTLRKLAKEFEDKGVLFYQIHSDPDLTVEDAKKHAKDFDVKSPVILDTDQKIARAHKAMITPEAVVIKKSGETVYRGRIDNTYTTYGKRRPEPTSRDLHAALASLVAGKKVPVAKTKAIGCMIYFESK